MTEEIKQKSKELLQYIQINEYKERIFPSEKNHEFFSCIDSALEKIGEEKGIDSIEYIKFNQLALEVQGKDVIPVYLVERIIGYLNSL